MPSSRSGNFSWGYVLVIAKFVILFIGTGIAKSFGVLISLMVERLHSDYATVGLICSLPATLQYLCGPFITQVSKKMNPRYVAVSGGILSGSCLLICGFLTNAVAVAICLACTGIGLSMTHMPTLLAIYDHFPENYIFMNTLTRYGYTAGSMLLPFITESALEAYGYAGAYIIIGGIAFNLVPCGATVRAASNHVGTPMEGHLGREERQNLHERDEEEISTSSEQNDGMCCQKENDDEIKEDTSEHSSLIQTLEQKTTPNGRFPWATSFFETCKRSCGLLNEPLYLFSILIHFLIYYTVYAWMLFLVPNAEQLGIPPSNAIFLSTFGGIGGVIGRTCFLILTGNGINVFPLYIAVGTINTASFLLDFISSAYGVRSVLAFVQGFCFFFEDAVMSTLCIEAVFDKNNFGMAVAISGFVGGLGATAAGFFTGYLFDIIQSFTTVFIIVGFIHAVIVVHLIIVIILIKRRQ